MRIWKIDVPPWTERLPVDRTSELWSVAPVSDVAGTVPPPVSAPPAPTVNVEFVIEPETARLAPGETTNGPVNVDAPATERDWSVLSTTDPDPTKDPAT